MRPVGEGSGPQPTRQPVPARPVPRSFFGLGCRESPHSLLPLQPRIIILHANRIRIALNINVAAITLLLINHSRAKILAALPRRKTIDMLPLRQRRLPLQPPPRTINRRRQKDPARQHNRRRILDAIGANSCHLSESYCSEESDDALADPHRPSPRIRARSFAGSRMTEESTSPRAISS